MTLAGRRVLVAVGGGIAAFKSAELVRELLRRGAEVRVMMTPSATRFVGAATFAGITGRPTVTDLFDPAHAGEIHVELGAWAEVVVVAPATANLLARLAAGLADDVVTTTVLCTEAPLVVAPAMHTRMWRSAATRASVATLHARGATFAGPVEGPLASGEIGAGRMAEPAAIVETVEARLVRAQDLSGQRVLVTAGPTLEDLDPVRFLGNRSSGKMGYAIAARAHARGAIVTLVTGPVSLDVPQGVDVRAVRGAREMERVVHALAPTQHAIIMAAAVADYRPAAMSSRKIKKQGARTTLELVRNPDILAALGARRRGRRPVLVGFAVETGQVVRYARRKLVEKGCDLVVANEARDAFGRDTNRVVLVERARAEALPVLEKGEVADRILDRVVSLLVPATRAPREPRRRPRRRAAGRRAPARSGR